MYVHRHKCVLSSWSQPERFMSALNKIHKKIIKTKSSQTPVIIYVRYDVFRVCFKTPPPPFYLSFNFFLYIFSGHTAYTITRYYTHISNFYAIIIFGKILRYFRFIIYYSYFESTLTLVNELKSTF